VAIKIAMTAMIAKRIYFMRMSCEFPGDWATRGITDNRQDLRDAANSTT